MSSSTDTPPGLDLKADRGPYLFWVCLIMIFVSTLVVGLRFAARKAARLPILFDDWTILIALPCVLMPCILDIYCTKKIGFGKHVQALDASDVTNVQNFWFHLWISNILYSTSIALTKISLLLYLHRNFPFKDFAVPAVIIGGMVLLWGFVSVMTTIFSCYPIRGFWDQSIDHKCINNFDFALGINIPDIIFDVAIMALALGWLWRIFNSLSQKVALGFVYGFAGFVVAIGTVRIQSLAEYSSSADFTWDFIPIAILSALETNSALICACLPALNPLLQFCLHGSFAPLPEVQTRPAEHTRPKKSGQQRDLSAEEAGELARITQGEAPRNYYQTIAGLESSGGAVGAVHGPSEHRATKAKKTKWRWTASGEAGDVGADAQPGPEPLGRVKRGFATPKESRFSDW